MDAISPAAAGAEAALASGRALDAGAERLTAWPDAPGAEDRAWRRLPNGEVDPGPPGLEALDLGGVADACWPAWSRSLRVAAGLAAGADGETEANRAGRALVRASGRDLRADREAVREAAAGFWDEGLVRTLRDAGIDSPALGDYNLAARHREVLERFVAAGERNVAMLALAVLGDGDWEWTGSVQKAAEEFLGIEDWPKAAKKGAWRRFRKLDPVAARRMDAAAMDVLAGMPEDGVVVERLTGGVIAAVSAFAARRRDERSRWLCGAVLTEACDPATDHGVLLERFAQARAWLAADGWPEGEYRAWGGFWRRVERRARDRRDALLAEAQAMRELEERTGWPGLLEPYSDGRVDVIELTTGAALAAEGEAMHHCVGTYASQCAAGRCRVFSLRIGGRRAATLALVPDGNGWKLDQLRGYRNRPGTDELGAVGRRLARRYGEASRAEAAA